MEKAVPQERERAVPPEPRRKNRAELLREEEAGAAKVKLLRQSREE